MQRIISLSQPHELDMGAWTNTVQAVVDAIRPVSTIDHMILLPGTQFTAAGTFPSQSSQLLNVKNPDGSTRNLIFDVHQYLDSDSSGTHTECTHNGVDSLTYLGNWLSSNGRQA
jgi:endoglucanase